MKTTLAILATSVAAVSFYLAKRRRNRNTGVLQGTFTRVQEAAAHA